MVLSFKTYLYTLKRTFDNKSTYIINKVTKSYNFASGTVKAVYFPQYFSIYIKNAGSLEL